VEKEKVKFFQQLKKSIMKIRLFKVWAKTWENWKTERERERKREDRHK
jgi:hypothetical protein